MRRKSAIIAAAAVAAALLAGCGNPADSGGGSQSANAVIITLTSWETKETDLLDSKLDPSIGFRVISYQNGRQISNNNTGYLLNAENVGQSWTGSKRSSPVPFMEQADELVIEAVVLEKDPLSDDDISPGNTYSVSPTPSAGKTGSATLDYGSRGKSKVRFDYEFIAQ